MEQYWKNRKKNSQFAREIEIALAEKLEKEKHKLHIWIKGKHIGIKGFEL